MRAGYCLCWILLLREKNERMGVSTCLHEQVRFILHKNTTLTNRLDSYMKSKAYTISLKY